MSPRSRFRSVAYAAGTLLIALMMLEDGSSWLMLVYHRAIGQQHLRVGPVLGDSAAPGAYTIPISAEMPPPASGVLSATR